MKTNVRKVAFALLSVTALLGACKKEDLRPIVNKNINKSEKVEAPQRTMTSDQQVTDQIMVQHRWKVSYFTSDGTTPHENPYRDYVFEFNDHHVILANKYGARPVSGKWNAAIINGEKKIIIDFGVFAFVPMNGTWSIAEHTSSHVNLYQDKRAGRAMLDFVPYSDMK